MKVFFAATVVVLFMMTVTGHSLAKEGSARESYLRGIEAGLAGELKAAEIAFTKSLEVDPGFTPARRWLKAVGEVNSGKLKSEALFSGFKGEKFWESGRLKEAKEEYDKAVMADPGFTNGYMAIGQILLQEGSYSDALKIIDRVLKIEPENGAAYVARASAHAAAGEMVPAFSDINYALKLDPESAAAYTTRGSLHMEAGSTDEALKDLSRAIELYSLGPAAYSMRGYLYMVKLRDRERGCADWKRACELGACDNFRSAVMAGLCS